MTSISIRHFWRLNLLRFCCIMLINGCASMQAPTGGPKDRTPPKVVNEIPKNLSRNFADKEIEIRFDEFVKLVNEYKEVSISPSMEKIPLFKATKNILHIKLQDSLQKNTTYTINFGKAIVDYNEGNVLRNYTYVFSTGNTIDSLSISGNVVQSLTKKPEIEIPVFIIPTKQDSIFGKKPASIFTTTDSAGNFTLRNLRGDTYRIYALKETGGGDRIYNSTTEDIAFQKDPIILDKNISDIKLTTFKENPAMITIQDRRIETDGTIFIKLNQPVNKPSLKILNPEESDRIKQSEFNVTGDTAKIWLPELTFDSLTVSVQSNGINADTVVLRRGKRDTYSRSVTIKDNIQNLALDPVNGLNLTFSAPVTSFDQGKITLLDDTVRLQGLTIAKDTSSLRRYKINYPWKAGHTYTLTYADGAFSGPYGSTKYLTSKFKLAPENLYEDMTLNITVPGPDSYILQILRAQDEVVKQSVFSTNTKIVYHNMPTGRYIVRVIYDSNKNGKWDTGDIKQKLQPENSWNYNKELILRPNVEIEEVISVPPPGP